MCGSMADIQSATAEIRRGKKRRKKKKKPQGKNIVVHPSAFVASAKVRFINALDNNNNNSIGRP